MLENAIAAENVPVVPVDQSRLDVANFACGRPEANNQLGILVSILRSELRAAMCLMEHRERWWTEGMLEWRWDVSAKEKCSPPRKLTTR